METPSQDLGFMGSQSMETPSQDLGFVGLMETMETHKDVSISHFAASEPVNPSSLVRLCQAPQYLLRLFGRWCMRVHLASLVAT